MEVMKPGMNPRDHIPRHRERGPKRYEYTYHGLAKRLGVSLSTVQGHRPSTPEALARLVHRQQVRMHARPLSHIAIGELIGEGKLPQWRNRWPRFELWWCGGCQSEVLFTKGLCESCGGGKPMMKFDSDFYFLVRVRRTYVPFHQLVLPTEFVVHHEDGNKWNNRPDNLVAMDSAGHLEQHQFGIDEC